MVWMAKVWLRLFGWRVDGAETPPARCVMVAAPHTSNWDLPFMLAIATVLGLKVRWLGKHTIFRGGVGWLFRALGGMPVDRRAAHGLVAQVVDVFGKSDKLILVVPPKGTRGRTKYWKSGFYRIALGANVPVCLGYLDFKRRCGGMGKVVTLTGDVVADMNRIRAFYRGIEGKYPHLESEPRLREEDEVMPEAKRSHG